MAIRTTCGTPARFRCRYRDNTKGGQVDDLSRAPVPAPARAGAPGAALR